MVQAGFNKITKKVVRKMRKVILIAPVIIVAILFSLSIVNAQMGPGMYGKGGYGGWCCPNCGGPGMMGQGRGMGRRGWGMCYQYGPQYMQPKKLEEKDAKEILENYLKSNRNPNLKLGKIKEKESAFEAEILTKENSLADKVIVDKATGWMRSAY